jgi:hypothetical protein
MSAIGKSCRARAVSSTRAPYAVRESGAVARTDARAAYLDAREERPEERYTTELRG